MSLPQISKGLVGKLEQMAPKRLILLAFMVSLLFTLLLYFYLAKLENEQQEKPPLTGVVIAAVDIPEKTVIKSEMLKTVQLPRELSQPDTVTDLSSVVGKTARISILQGDPVTEKKLFGDIRLAGFTGSIPADKRAMSIAITDTTAISGFAQPGDYVDVMLVTDKAYPNTISGEMILQNILLLAINKSSAATAGSKDGKAEQMATATLAVDPAAAVRLAVAQSQGMVYLVLRPLQPKESFVLTTKLLAQFGQAPEMPRPAQADSAAPPVRPAPEQEAPVQKRADGILVIRGSSANMVEVR
ncbi:Flp pilus assembly protein CpaB|uniref:Pilus assembly protein CpaB n=1 Tax=Dendrosporobacter quercicolus TaxID=146817 RepID=A0A1H0A3J8_9FIRM|nr:Flp pilus assembly protein CpaB [Dendrosporobacter quercicolus]NSL49988.1 Flp pilus assembly protein CpaB [Dendrosporobacter quercicolus DSM 1736]SDN27533.1 pilus assembly protein CpaB [Dendrosporobacter quercicolus]